MEGDFSETTLATLLSFANGRSSPDRADGAPYPVYGSNGIIGYAGETNAEPPAIIIGRVGSYCGSLYLSRQRCWVTDNAIRAAALDDHDARFLFYLLGTLDLNNWRAGSGQPLLNQDILRRIPALVPQPDEQRTIAGVLGALDDKIEQNRRTAQALEKLARAIFRAWFVDFEPVKAKAAGATGFPSMPQPVFDALPTTFVDSGIGPVPDGWEVKCLSGAFEVNPKRPLRKGMVAPYLDMKNMPTTGHAPASWTERAFGSGMRFRNGDTLVARITPCLENGKTAFVDFPAGNEIGWGSTEYIVLRPRAPLPPVFAYCLARTPGFRDFAIQNMSGTSGRQRVSATAMDYYQLAVPPEETVIAFANVVKPMFDSIRSGVNESRKLAELRDYLLPKLLSGQIRVRDAERLAATVA